MTMSFGELQKTFKRVNPHVLRMWRWHLGWLMSAFPPVTGKTMVVTHTGRKSGRRLQTPVNYAVIDGAAWCTTNQRAQWLANVRAAPDVEVWLPLRRPRAGVAEVMALDAEHVRQYRTVLIASGFAASRFGGIKPRRTSDADLLERGSEYVLMRITRGDRVPRRALRTTTPAP